MKPVKVIDADGHICEPELVWTQYTSSKYRDVVLQVCTENGRSSIAIKVQYRAAGDGRGQHKPVFPVV